MNLAHDLIVDQLPPAESQQPLATWYTQGHSDAFGDRLLMFDNTSAPSWEILRFRPALARIPAFDRAVRDRLNELRSFQHPAFPIVRYIEELGRDDGLAVASTYSTGVWLTEALNKPRSAAFTVRLLGELLPALAALQRHGDGMSHGALTLGRIGITGEGQLTIREHMVGSALASLGLTTERLWAEFGIAAYGDRESVPALDQRNDVVQIALIALSLMVGRQVGPEEPPSEIDRLLDDVVDRNAASVTNPGALDTWLRRALQIAPDPFESAQDATDSLADVNDAGFASGNGANVRGSGLDLQADSTVARPRLVASRPSKALDPVAIVAEPESGPMALPEPDRESASRSTNPSGTFRLRIATAAAIATAVIAGAETWVIGRNLQARPPIPQPAAAALSIDAPEPGTQVWVDGRLVGSTPFELRADPRIHSVRLRPPDTMAVEAPITASLADAKPGVNRDEGGAVRPGATIQKSGGVQLTSPVALYVLEGERMLGASSDGPIFAPAGVHELDLVNTSVGLRIHRTVNIRPGQISKLTVSVPNGTLNINAVPWASVWVDGNAAGETPIGNLSITPGQHEIVFRHPQLGERRQSALVRADGPTRVTANLQR